MDRPHAQAQAHPHPHPHRYPSHTKPIHYNRVPIGGPDRPPVTQSPSPGTIYASPSGDREISSYPIPSNGSPKRELGSPDIKRESGARDDSDQTADRSSVATRRSSTAYPDVSNEESKAEDAAGEPQRKKQKRNKPTLSCFECVERKTKVGLLSLAHLDLLPSPMASAVRQVPVSSALVKKCNPESLCIPCFTWPMTLNCCLNLIKRVYMSWRQREDILSKMLPSPT